MANMNILVRPLTCLEPSAHEDTSCNMWNDSVADAGCDNLINCSNENSARSNVSQNSTCGALGPACANSSALGSAVISCVCGAVDSVNLPSKTCNIGFVLALLGSQYGPHLVVVLWLACGRRGNRPFCCVSSLSLVVAGFPSTVTASGKSDC